MQAHRLRAADAPHHAQVVKALVDHTAHSAAFLLADSSCLLVSLIPSASPASSYIPSPCTDACFLRLLARPAAGTSSPISSNPRHPLHRGGAKISPGSSGEPILQNGGLVGQPRVGFGEMILDAQILDAASSHHGSATAVDHRNGADTARMRPRSQTPMGTGIRGAIKGQVFLLAARPGKGGSRTDLMGWRCHPHCFSQVPTSISSSKLDVGIDGGSSSVSRRVASLDVPHGMIVKLSATVNVVALYSVGAGKVWIMSARTMESGCKNMGQNPGPRSIHGNGSPAAVNNSDRVSNDNKAKRFPEMSDAGSEDRLHLMKCAVVDCNSPVFSLHLSPQYLMLGERGGIRVFHLRSLVKPRKGAGKAKERTPVNGQPYLCEDSTSNWSLFVLDRLGRGDSNGRGSPNDGDTDETWTVHSTNEKKREELLYSVGSENDETATKSPVFVATGTRNGIHAHGLVFQGAAEMDHDLTVPFSESIAGEECGPGYMPKETGAQCSKAYLLDGFLFGNEVELGHELENELGKRLCEIPSCRGTEASSMSFNKNMPSHLLSVQTFRHSTGYSSLMSSGKINAWRNGTIPKSRQELITHACYEPYYPKLTHAMPLPSKIQDCKELHLGSGQGIPIFVGLAGGASNEGVSSAITGAIHVQVVDIQCLSAKAFVVLDSSGKLHLMTLQNSWFQCNNGDYQELRTQVLKTSLKVLALTVLPALSSGSGSPAFRTMWLADGGHSIHIVSLPRDACSKKDGGRSAAIWDCFPELPVMRAIYTKDPVTALLASSPSSVMVLGPGRTVTYVLSRA